MNKMLGPAKVQEAWKTSQNQEVTNLPRTRPNGIIFGYMDPRQKKDPEQVKNGSIALHNRDVFRTVEDEQFP